MCIYMRKRTRKMTKPLLDKAPAPQDLRKLDRKDLRQFADELRQEMIDAVSITGGPLGAGGGGRYRPPYPFRGAPGGGGGGGWSSPPQFIPFSTRRKTASSGMSAIRPIRIKSSPAAATVSARSGRARVCPDSQNVRKAN